MISTGYRHTLLSKRCPSKTVAGSDHVTIDFALHVEQIARWYRSSRWSHLSSYLQCPHVIAMATSGDAHTHSMFRCLFRMPENTCRQLWNYWNPW